VVDMPYEACEFNSVRQIPPNNPFQEGDASLKTMMSAYITSLEQSTTQSKSSWLPLLEIRRVASSFAASSVYTQDQIDYHYTKSKDILLKACNNTIDN
jgi:hypothetical protein